MSSRIVRLASGEVLDVDDLDPAKIRPPPRMPIAREVVSTMGRVVQCPRTDREILDAILSSPECLTMRETQSFGGMRNSMASQSLLALSYAQRSWAQEVAARLGFDVESPTGWRETHNAVRAIPRGCKR